MKSLRRAASNQRNAKSSTGPKTTIGKARSALNAATHGLSGKFVLDAEAEQRCRNSADALADGHGKNPEVMMLAYEAAEAQINVKRVKEARAKAWNAAPQHRSVKNRGIFAALNNRTEAREFKRLEGISVRDLRRLMPDEFMEPFENDMERDDQVLKIRLDSLTKLLRYELRAINQSDRSMKALDEAIGRAGLSGG